MIVYVNGEYLPLERATVSMLDGGLLYGDGVFETMRLYAGRPFDLAGHLARMSRNLEELEFAWRPDAERFDGILRKLAARNDWSDRDMRGRITVTRGAALDDPLPLTGHEDLPPTVTVFVKPLGARLGLWHSQGVTVLPLPRDSVRGNFPHLKTLNYLPTVMALRAAARARCAEALFVDADGRVREGAASNVFAVRDGALTTPPLAQGLLPGRTRALVLELAAAQGVTTREEPLSLDDVLGADELFLCGSVKEIVPVTAVGERKIADGRPGPLTRALQDAYRRGVLDALGGRDRGRS